MVKIYKKDLKIPRSLDKWFKDHKWANDYWKELPLNWDGFSDWLLKQYPITDEIRKWRKARGAGNEKS
jgi:hypothetical protein